MLETTDPFTVALVVGEDDPPPLLHAAMIGPGLLCDQLRVLGRGMLRWTEGVAGVSCPRCHYRLKELTPRQR
jgi:hypothetical protein